MRVKVTAWIDMPDPDEWAMAYGIEEGVNIRKDVKAAIGQHLQDFAPFSNGEVQAEITWE